MEKQAGIFMHVNKPLFWEKRQIEFVTAGTFIRINTELKKSKNSKITTF